MSRRRTPNEREAAAISLGCFIAQPVLLDDRTPGIVIELSETATSQIYQVLWDDPEIAKRVLAQLGHAIEHAWPGTLTGGAPRGPVH